jgi:hypothetical protein
MLNIEDKRKLIKEKFDNEFNSNKKLVELDFEFNLILSATQSYKHDTVLKPFPSLFLINDNEQKYNDLVSKTKNLHSKLLNHEYVFRLMHCYHYPQ